MADIVNWYDKIPNENNKKKLPKNWKNHHIHHNSMILCVGGTGTGKTNALIDYLSRTSGEFHKIIIVSFSTLDEPLYNFLQQKSNDIEFINNIDDVPDLNEFDDENKNKPKLIVFDDFINLSKKQMGVLADCAISSRKFNFTCVFMAQSYTSVPKVISRNCNYIMIFKINAKISIKRILYNHGLTEQFNPEQLEHYYYCCINQPLGFLTIDLKLMMIKKRIRCGFNDILH